MSLKSQTEAALQGLAAFSAGSKVLDVSEGGQRMQCELTALDSLGCAFSRFELTSDALASADINRLRGVADNLSKRLTYLLEPISPIEVDADQCVVQLRSNPPQKDDTGTSYYELLVRRGGQLSLQRYTKQPDGQRGAVPAQVTREVLLRLVDDFAAAAV
jgi:hypothetical protein